MKERERTTKLVECAIMVAVSVVLSMIKLWQMPLGGEVTPASMLPICIISYRNGTKWGFTASFVLSLFELFIGISMSGLLGWGLTPSMLIGCILFDYIIAYTVLGIAGIFREKGIRGFFGGVVLAVTLRFISHCISGYVIFANFERWQLFGQSIVASPMLYSICYNAFFMLPELIITVIAAGMLIKVISLTR